MYEEHHEVTDYEQYRLPGTGYRIRGPQPATLAPGEYFTCVGAAQTFGCFSEKPYPALLAERLDLSPLNFGFAGAGPRFFLRQEASALVDYVNQGRFAIVQVMSARSEDNSAFDTSGQEYLTRRSDGQRMGAERAYRELLAAESLSTVQALVAETRENWIQSYTRLLERIEVPTILFWFSTRSPDYEEDYSSDIYAFFGEFPQLVTRSMVEQIKGLGDEYVECISDRGLPQPLVSRFTGEPVPITVRADLGEVWSVNPYYPSPEMHADAAEALVAPSRALAIRASANV
jgi:hypothetical protein